MVARAPAQVLRLSMIYALLDKSTVIRKEHLEAALEIWRYCEDSVRFIFGDRLGDVTADRILSGLRAAPGGLTKTDISGLFGKNRRGEEIDRALLLLRESGLAWSKQESTGGRSAERWFATRQDGAGNAQ